MKIDSLEAFDIAEYLDSDEMISEYLSQVLEDGDSDEFLQAIGNITRAKGIASIAQKSGLGRESLYKTFKPQARPRFETVIQVMKALDIRFSGVATA